MLQLPPGYLHLPCETIRTFSTGKREAHPPEKPPGWAGNVVVNPAKEKTALETVPSACKFGKRKRERELLQELIEGRGITARQELLMEEYVPRKIGLMTVDQLESRHSTSVIQFYLDEDAETDALLKSPAAIRYFSRGPNFSPTPFATSEDDLRQDLYKLENRIMGNIIREILTPQGRNALARAEEDAGLHHFQPPKPSTRSEFMSQLKGRRSMLNEYGLGEVVFQLQAMHHQTVTELRNYSDKVKTSRSWRPFRELPEDEMLIHHHVKARGDIKICKLDKNLGIAVASTSILDREIDTHLASINLKQIDTGPDKGPAEMRQDIRGKIAEHGKRLLENDAVPTAIQKLLLRSASAWKQTDKLCHMYVVLKKNSAITRPIVPEYASQTATAARWIHEQLLPSVKDIPSICMDSVTYAQRLDRIQLPKNWEGRMLNLDIEAMYPSIPLEDGIPAIRDFLEEDTKFTREGRNIILRVLEWVLASGYIEHKNKFYRQVNGAIMGSAVSVVLAVIYVYVRIEKKVLEKWNKTLIDYARYIDDLQIFANMTERQALDFKQDLERQVPSIKFKMTTSRTRTSFLDLDIMVNRDEDQRPRIDYRIYRKPGNAMTYLLASSFHPPHVFTAIIRGELIRYLTKTSREAFFIDDVEILRRAFTARGYKSSLFNEAQKEINWERRAYYRDRALAEKTHEIPAKGAVFSTVIEPTIVTAMADGFSIDLSSVRGIPTNTTDAETRQALGNNLTSSVPEKALIALKAAPKIQQLTCHKRL